MNKEIEFLKNLYPNSEIFPSLDKDSICIRTITGKSNFGKKDNGEPIIVNITDTQKFHINTIRLRMNDTLAELYKIVLI